MAIATADPAGHARPLRIALVHLPATGSNLTPGIHIMAMGLLALGAELDSHGHHVQVIHAGVEQRATGHGFDLAADVQTHGYDLVGLSLHWHHQLQAVEQAVQAIRDRGLHTRVVLGGLTATAFADAILQQMPGVDFVLRGEADRSLPQLAQALSLGQPLERIEGLSYRRDGRLHANDLGPPLTQDEFDRLQFTRLELLRHDARYNAQFAPSALGFHDAPVFYLTTGRGCSTNCAFCGGGRQAHRAASGRVGPLFRSIERVAGDIRTVMSRGIQTCCVCFDPAPLSEPYYLQLFDALREQRLRPAMVFECYGPPSDEFVASFAHTFDLTRSRLTMSPTVADESLRATLLGRSFDNASLEHALQQCARKAIDTTLYFAAVPQESPTQFERSLGWQRTLAQRFGCRIIHAPLEMEPLAPWEHQPQRWGLRHVRQGLDAYRKRHAAVPSSYAATVGYHFPDLDRRLVRARGALTSPELALARAISTCGSGLLDRQVLAAPDRLADALSAAQRWKGTPLTVIASCAQGQAELVPIIEVLGPLTRVLSLPPNKVMHKRITGRGTPVAGPRDGVLLVHLDNEDAAHWWLSRQEPLPDRVIVAQACRWAALPCPARDPRLLSIASDGSLRVCPSSPSWTPHDDLERHLNEAAKATEARRGCDRCEIRDHCARCVFLGNVTERSYCEMSRRLGRNRPRCNWRQLVGSLHAGIAIGWDD